VVIKDTVAIAPRSPMERSTTFSSPPQTCYNIIYELNATAVKTPRPRIIFITPVRIDTLVYCTSVFNCGVFGLFDNSTYPIGPVSNLDAQVNITYSEGANASGTVVSYPTVEIRPTTTHRFDVKTLEVILHYDPVYYVPADIVFGYIHFRVAPVTPPTISITFPSEDTTIVVSDTYLPTMILQERHTPPDAVVTWRPSNIISAAEYMTSASAETTVTVTATATRPCGGEQTATRRVTFKKNLVDHFEITCEQDTVAFTESAKIFVQAKDVNNQNIELAADKLVTFTVTTNAEYGTFIDQDGDTLKTTPVKLEHIPYADAKAGEIQFAAVKKNPVDPVLCNVKAELESDPSKAGEARIPVVEQTLKIVMEPPREVRPSIPTEDADTNMTKLRKKTFEVQMTRNKAAVPNHPFRLWTNYVEQTGGHDHGDTRTVRQTDNNDNYGYFVAEGKSEHRRPLDDVTNANGKFEVTYNASIFGDSMRIYLQSRDPQKAKFFKDSVTVVEKVEGLINFRNVVSNGRWTFAQSATGATRHADNNWCSQSMSNNLQKAIRKFYNWSMDTLESPFVLSLNDMSLIFGGRFDVSGKWDSRNSQAHLYHRKGTSVDINDPSNRIKIDDGSRYGKWTAIGIKLKNIFDDYGLSPENERPVHFELRY